MKSADNTVRRVAVIAGGISGLAAAHRLVEIDPAIGVSLFEASGRLGGVLETTREGGFLIERSADNFITDVPWGTDLCRRVGLGDRLLSTNEVDRRALVVCRGKLEPIPEGFAIMAPRRLTTMLTTPILSVTGKLRLAAEYFVPRGAADDDESLASFARRRFGRETYERLIQPLVGGIYTADPQKLSLKATLPRFAEMEQRHRSLIRAAWSEPRPTNDSVSAGGVRYGLFTAPQDGLASLVSTIESRLPQGAVHRRQRIDEISHDPSGAWRLTSDGTTFGPFDALIIAAPGPHAARLFSTFDAELSTEIASIDYAGCVVVALGYARSQIARPLDGFGFVVPLIERRQILSASFSSVKYAGRAPQDHVLIRVFLGGACQGELLDKDDRELARIAAGELADLLSIHGEPCLTLVSRHERAMPQYHVGHLARVARIEQLVQRHAGLALAGNAYRGVGIPQCIRSGEEAAQRIVAGLRGPG